ncbi:hypothetical protein B0T18DRAFT_329227 [Schizothecium vesticola]|uniref:CST complex subunit STN1 n=1 Tax=Schizothecium vesticola TaxID=314040 RepID=A0AA40K2D2_9PEZI|nr:hypothetical protein B0T18DRAFT_329227 [Schizothecium vesticola]
MTSPEQPEFYPQYCFHLSPTVGKWCHLRAADVAALSSHPGFGGQNVFFHRNHPIQWVRISGIVTAIDEFAGRRAYTIDDGSGATMECHVLLSEVAKTREAITLETKPNVSATPAKIIVTTPINTGDIIDVKGTIRIYRDMKQIKAEKMVLVRTTEQEVQFWEKVVKLRREVLDRPWVLDPRVVRRCRKEEEGEQRHRARKRTRSPSAAVEMGQPRPPLITGLEKSSATLRTAKRPVEPVLGLQPSRSERPDPEPKVLVTGLEKKHKTKTKQPIPVTGKYSALGL